MADIKFCTVALFIVVTYNFLLFSKTQVTGGGKICRDKHIMMAMDHGVRRFWNRAAGSTKQLPRCRDVLRLCLVIFPDYGFSHLVEAP